jgi:hypothetical protein
VGCEHIFLHSPSSAFNILIIYSLLSQEISLPSLAMAIKPSLAENNPHRESGLAEVLIKIDFEHEALCGAATSVNLKPIHLLPLRATDTALDSPCPGFELKMPDCQSPYTSYPFEIHAMGSYPWTPP